MQMSTSNAIATQAIRIYRQGDIKLARAIWSDAIELVRLKKKVLNNSLTPQDTRH
jgi:hypothetical protein